MICAALRAGPLAHAALLRSPRAILASHARAAVLRLPSGALVSVLPRGEPLHPWAVTTAGEVAGLAPVGGACTVEIAGAELVSLSLGERPAAPPAAAAIAALAAALEAAGVSPPSAPFAAASAAALEVFAARREVGPLAALVGVGEGLTPSGDDVLVGILAGLDLARDSRPGAAGARVRLCSLLCRQQPGRTTPLSAQMIAAAAAGLYPEPLLEVLTALQDPDLPLGRLAAAGKLLAAVGHRSGSDMLRGLLASLSCPVALSATRAPAARRSCRRRRRR